MAESDGKTTAELAEEALRTTSNWMYDDGLTDHDADEGARLKALADTARAALFARIAADAEEREALERVVRTAVRMSVVLGEGIAASAPAGVDGRAQITEALADIARATIALPEALAARLASDTETR